MEDQLKRRVQEENQALAAQETSLGYEREALLVQTLTQDQATRKVRTCAFSPVMVPGQVRVAPVDQAVAATSTAAVKGGD